MSAPCERRSGRDRRHRFLNCLDRRQSPPPFFVLGFDSGDDARELYQSNNPVSDSTRWGEHIEVSPV